MCETCILSFRSHGRPQLASESTFGMSHIASAPCSLRDRGQNPLRQVLGKTVKVRDQLSFTGSCMCWGMVKCLLGSQMENIAEAWIWGAEEARGERGCVRR